MSYKLEAQRVSFSVLARNIFYHTNDIITRNVVKFNQTIEMKLIS